MYVATIIDTGMQELDELKKAIKSAEKGNIALKKDKEKRDKMLEKEKEKAIKLKKEKDTATKQLKDGQNKQQQEAKQVAALQEDNLELKTKNEEIEARLAQELDKIVTQ